MGYVEHWKLETPRHGVLWRYMDFAKFVQLLETQSLWFARADQFEDPFEGTLTDGEIQYRRAAPAYARVTRRDASDLLETTLRHLWYLRATTYVNCWRMGRGESMAMWDLYGKGGGLAIQTSVSQLTEHLNLHPEEFTVARVRYIDWKSEDTAQGGNLGYHARKDKSYEHEAEVRAMFTDQTKEQLSLLDQMTKEEAEMVLRLLATDLPAGRAISVNLQKMLSAVFVGPREPKWMRDLVERLIGRYNLELPVYASDRLSSRKASFEETDFNSERDLERRDI